MLAKGELDFAFAQSDWQLAAYEGTGAFAGRAMTNLRSVMSLYPETITILAGRDSGIFTANDLLGKRIDIGLPASGRHATAAEILRRSGVQISSFRNFAELTQEQAIEGLCDGSIDATLFVVGHPSSLVADAMARCRARIIAPTGPAFTRALEGAADFEKATISADSYPDLLKDVETYSVYATVVTRVDMPFVLVNEMVANMVANLEQFAAELPQLRNLTVEDMQSKGLSAPLHSAAKLAFEEAINNAKGL
jgi:TRAP transporter TAXI family solute receptor